MARSAVNVGHPRWSSTNDSGVVLAEQAQHGLDHVVAGLAADPRGTDDRGDRASRSFAGELRDAVDRARVRLVRLHVRPVERPVEHVVGTDLYEVGADDFTGLTEEPDRRAVVALGSVGVPLAGVDGRPRRAVDDDVGSGSDDTLAHLGRVAHVELRPIERDHVVARPRGQTRRGRGRAARRPR